MADIFDSLIADALKTPKVDTSDIFGSGSVKNTQSIVESIEALSRSNNSNTQRRLIDEQLKQQKLLSVQQKTAGEKLLADEVLEFNTNPKAKLDEIAKSRGFESYDKADFEQKRQIYGVAEEFVKGIKDPRSLMLFRSQVPMPTKGNSKSDSDTNALLGAVKDLGGAAIAGLAKGVAGVVALPDIALAPATGGPTFLSRAAKGISDLGTAAQEGLETKENKAYRDRLAAAFEKDDVTELTKTIIDNPARLAVTMTEIAGMFIAPGGAAKGIMAAGKATKLLSELTEQAATLSKSGSIADRALGRVIANRTAILANSIAGGGAAAQEGAQLGQEIAAKRGIDPNSTEGQQLIGNTIGASGAAGLGIGALTGVGGAALGGSAEQIGAKLLSGAGRRELADATATGGVKGFAGGVARAAVVEGLQEGIESTAPKLGATIATGEKFDSYVSLTESLMGAIVGGNIKALSSASNAITGRAGNKAAADANLNQQDEQSDTSSALNDIVLREVNAFRSSPESAAALASLSQASDLGLKTAQKQYREGILAAMEISPEYQELTRGKTLPEVQALKDAAIANIDNTLVVDQLVKAEDFTAELVNLQRQGATLEYQKSDGEIETVKLTPAVVNAAMGKVVQESLTKKQLDIRSVRTPELRQNLVADIKKEALQMSLNLPTANEVEAAPAAETIAEPNVTEVAETGAQGKPIPSLTLEQVNAEMARRQILNQSPTQTLPNSSANLNANSKERNNNGLQETQEAAQEEVALAKSEPSQTARVMPSAVQIVAKNGALKNLDGYQAAKNGDIISAINIVNKLLTDESVQKIAAQANGSVLVPVINFSEKNANRIPQAMAIKIHHDTGLPYDISVLRKTPDGRTTMNGVDRLFDTPEFNGEVKRGQKYYLLDDTITMGGTLAALSKYITDRGGIVTGASVMTGQERSATLAMTPETRVKLEQEVGELEGNFYAATTRRFNQLTESEARFILRDLGEFRANLAARGNRQGDRDNVKGVQETGRDQPSIAPEVAPTATNEAETGRGEVIGNDTRSGADAANLGSQSNGSANAGRATTVAPSAVSEPVAQPSQSEVSTTADTPRQDVSGVETGKFEANPVGTLPAFAQIKVDQFSSIREGFEFAQRVVGVAIPVPIIKESIPSGALSMFIRGQGIIANLGAKSPSSGHLAQVMLEEYLHAIDVSSGESLAYRSGKFSKESEIYKEAEAARFSDGPLSEFLEYPIDGRPADWTDETYAAELFANLGVAYISDPETFKQILPKAYEYYENSPIGGRSISDGLSQRRPETRDVQSNPIQTRRILRPDNSGAKSWTEDPQLASLRRRFFGDTADVSGRAAAATRPLGPDVFSSRPPNFIERKRDEIERFASSAFKETKDKLSSETSRAAIFQDWKGVSANFYESKFVPTNFLSQSYERFFGKDVTDWYDALRSKNQYTDNIVTQVQQKIFDRLKDLTAKEQGELKDFMKDSQFEKWSTKIAQTGGTLEQNKLTARWKVLSPTAQRIFRDATGVFAQIRKDKQAELERIIGTRTNLSADTKRSLISGIMGGFQDDYLPLVRSGKLVFTVKDNKGNLVAFEQGDSAGALDLIRQKYIKAGYKVSETVAKTEIKAQLDGASQKFVEGQLNQISELTKNDPDLEADLRNALLESYLKTSGRGSSLKRKLIQGDTIDMLRGIAIESRRQANVIGALKIKDKVADSIKAMEETVRQMQDSGSDQALGASRALNMIKSHSETVQPAIGGLDQAVDKSNAIVATMFLGLSPAAAAINMTQLIQQTMPYLFGLGSRYNTSVNPIKELTSAMRQAVKLLNVTSQSPNISLETKKLLQMMESLDIASPGEITEVINTARYGSQSRVFSEAARIGNILNEKAERINRYSTFLAAYNVAKKAGRSEQDAQYDAKKAVDNTQFLGNDANKPLIIKQYPILKVAYVLKTFALSVYGSIYADTVKLVKDKSITKAEKQEILRRLIGGMGAQALLAGPFALITPIAYAGITLMSALLSATGADDDEFEWAPWDTDLNEARVARFFKANLGDTAANLLTGGIPKALGLNIRGNVQQDFFFRGQIISERTGDTPKDLLLSSVPIVNILGAGVESVAKLASGDLIGGIDKAASTQRSTAALRRAYNAYDMGGAVIAKDGTILAELSTAELAAYAAGFSPVEVSEKQAQRQLARKLGGRYTVDKRAISDAVAMAIMAQEINGDDSKMEGLQELFDKFNERYSDAEDGVQLSPDKELARIKKKLEKNREVYEEGQFKFGPKGKTAYIKSQLGIE